MKKYIKNKINLDFITKLKIKKWFKHSLIAGTGVLGFGVWTLQAANTDLLNLFKTAWFNQNTGEPVIYDLDPLQQYRLGAKAGEQIRRLKGGDFIIRPKKIKVAILDTGVDTKHPLLVNRIVRKPSECLILEELKTCNSQKDLDFKKISAEAEKKLDEEIKKNPNTDFSYSDYVTTKMDEKYPISCEEKILNTENNKVDQDKNLYPGDCEGWSFEPDIATADGIPGTPVIRDNEGHGTHVAFLTAAQSPYIEIIPVKVISEAPNEPIKPLSTKDNLHVQQNSNQDYTTINDDELAKQFEAAAGSLVETSSQNKQNRTGKSQQNKNADQVKAFSQSQNQTQVQSIGARKTSVIQQALSNDQNTNDQNDEDLLVNEDPEMIEPLRSPIDTSSVFQMAPSAVTRGIYYAINAGADVINLSVGWPETSNTQEVRDAIKEAQRRGIIIVAAAGNDSTNAILRPCQFEGVICVGATRPDGTMAHFSNYGYGVDIAAPGVSILSALPMSMGPVRLPQLKGLDILSGTSQATPIVSGLIADLLARGVNKNEIYPRLILGARPLAQKELPVIVGLKKTKSSFVQPQTSYKRYVLSGIIDAVQSFNLDPQPLILNADKEIQPLLWDRQTADLELVIPVKNYWKDVSLDQVSFRIKEKKLAPAPVPQVVGYELITEEMNLDQRAQPNLQSNTQQSVPSNTLSIEQSGAAPEENNSDEEPLLSEGSQSVWKQNVVYKLKIKLKIKDQTDASLSQINSELAYEIQPLISGQAQKSFESRAEILFQLSKNSTGVDIEQIPIEAQSVQGLKLFLVGDAYDKNMALKDYIGLKRNENSFSIQLLKQVGATYQASVSKTVTTGEFIKASTPIQFMRLDIDFDQKSEYVVIFQECVGENKNCLEDYKLHYYFFDDKLNIKKYATYYDERELIPVRTNWIRVGNTLRPAWVEFGNAIPKKVDITTLMRTVDQKPSPTYDDDIRLFYLDENFNLKTFDAPAGYKISDAINQSASFVEKGILTVLLVKNEGSDTNPSFINRFYYAYIQNLKLSDLTEIVDLRADKSYMNLVKTRVDKVNDLQNTDNEYRGMFWFAGDAHKSQRVVIADFINKKIYDQIITAKSTIYDNALRVRAAYSGRKTRGVFYATNTEFEYIDFNTQTSASMSLNKYTFYGNNLNVDLQFPITVSSRDRATEYPALMLTAGTQISRGVKISMPIFNSKNEVIGISTPARLRPQSPMGCFPLDGSVFLGKNNKKGSYALDFQCKDKIIRWYLKF